MPHLLSRRAIASLLAAAIALASVLSSSEAQSLPDAPTAAAPTAPTAPSFRDVNPLLRTASPYDKFIDPGQAVPRLSVKDKVVMGLLDDASPIVVLGWISSAGLEQATNGKPHYGTNGSAYAERFGASALRDVSEDVFSDSILSPILREDPRYYIMGRAHGPAKRFFYAATRTLVTRTDSGHATVNLALIGGNAGGAALSQLYYPTVDRGVSNIGQIFVGSMGGSALGFVITEFFTGVFEDLHLKRSSAR